MALELRVVSSIQEVDSAAWNLCAGDHPFVQHAFLNALEMSGALGIERGVLPRYLLLSDSVHGLVACAPAMLKWGNKREFGPEIHWLKAGLEAGCFAWPKFQIGIPFFPVMGPKLLIRAGLAAEPLRKSLLQALYHLGRCQDLSVVNVMHVDADTACRLQAIGCLLTCEWHSMWMNAGYTNYSDYLAALPEQKRYQSKKDRRRAEAHGMVFHVLKGREIKDEILADYYEGHRRVCARYAGKPWLSAETYQAIVAALVDSSVLMGYFESGRFIAGTLKLQNANVLYALQWSELIKLDRVALDLICHRPIEYAIEHGLKRLDSGLAAAHKKHRGWQTIAVYHAHWFYNAELRSLALRVRSSGDLMPNQAKFFTHKKPSRTPSPPSSIFCSKESWPSCTGWDDKPQMHTK